MNRHHLHPKHWLSPSSGVTVTPKCNGRYGTARTATKVGGCPPEDRVTGVGKKQWKRQITAPAMLNQIKRLVKNALAVPLLGDSSKSSRLSPLREAVEMPCPASHKPNVKGKETDLSLPNKEESHKWFPRGKACL